MSSSSSSVLHETERDGHTGSGKIGTLTLKRVIEWISNQLLCYCLLSTHISTRLYIPGRRSTIDPRTTYTRRRIWQTVPEECRDLNKAWPILRIPATSLIGAGFKHINRLVTRKQCAELCLSEREFLCKSASFRQTQRNNYNRERERDFILTEGDAFDTDDDVIPQGECILSREDKNSKPDAFRVANDNVREEYIENQCVPQGQWWWDRRDNKSSEWI